MRMLIMVAALAAASPAAAKDITIIATQTEVQQLAQLLDIATKSCGLQCAQASVFWAQKLQAAVDEANKPVPSTEVPK